jgi:Ca2+-binding RTX toxin-like protein
VSISGGTASDGYGGTDTFSNIENVRGSAFNDHLKGDANVNWLEGGAGNDTLYGFTGNDVFVFAPSGVGVDTILDFRGGRHRWHRRHADGRHRHGGRRKRRDRQERAGSAAAVV